MAGRRACHAQTWKCGDYAARAWSIAAPTVKVLREAGTTAEEYIMGLLVMILGLVLFLGAHTLTTQREVRARVIAASGEGGYKVGYALVSIGGLALIAWGFGHYRAAGMIDVWEKWCSPEVLGF